jgi:predicted ABC-type exoprotein transport system permease subunit
MKRSLLITTFQLAELALRIGLLLLVYPALGKAVEKSISDDPSRALFHLIVLFGIAVLIMWKSKELAVQLVDIIRKPILNENKR